MNMFWLGIILFIVFFLMMALLGSLDAKKRSRILDSKIFLLFLSLIVLCAMVSGIVIMLLNSGNIDL